MQMLESVKSVKSVKSVPQSVLCKLFQSYCFSWYDSQLWLMATKVHKSPGTKVLRDKFSPSAEVPGNSSMCRPTHS